MNVLKCSVVESLPVAPFPVVITHRNPTICSEITPLIIVTQILFCIQTACPQCRFFGVSLREFGEQVRISRIWNSIRTYFSGSRRASPLEVLPSEIIQKIIEYVPEAVFALRFVGQELIFMVWKGNFVDITPVQTSRWRFLHKQEP